MTRSGKLIGLVVVSVCAGLFLAKLLVPESAPAPGRDASPSPSASGSPVVIPRESPAVEVIPAESDPPAATASAPPARPAGEERFYSDPEQVARRFIEGYLSFDYRDPDPTAATRQRTRPWATPRLNNFLDGGSSGAYRTQQRIESHEVRTVEIASMDPVSPMGPEIQTFVSLGRAHITVNGPAPFPAETFFELTVVLQDGKWLVDRMLT